MNEMSRSKLRELIESGYTLFLMLLAELDDGQLTEPGILGKWSVKDILAHILIHEQRMLQWVTQRLRGKHPVLPQPYAMPDDELDILNEHIYQDNQHRKLDEILRDFHRTHAESLRLVETATEEDILDPRRLQLHGGEPLWEAIAANTFWHYEEHSQDIRAWQLASHSTLT